MSGALGGAMAGNVSGAAQSGSRNAYYNIALMAGMQALAALTQPGPKRPGKDAVKVNYADAAQVWPYIAGTVKMYPHLIWWGDYATKKIRNDDAILNITTSAGIGALSGYLAAGGHFNTPTPDPPSAVNGLMLGGMSGAVAAGLGQLRTASYKHLAGFAYGICHGPIDRIKTVWFDDKEAYTSSSDNAGNAVLIDKPKLWGGEHELGGVYALCDIVRGDFWPTQQPNTYLAAQIAGAEAFSGKALFIFRGPSGFDQSGYFAATPAESPIVRPIALEVVRLPNNLGVPTYKACGSDSLDANPAEVAYEWITNRVFGGRLTPSRVDLASFQAAALTHYTEGLGCSLELNREYDVESALDDITSLADAAIHGSLHSGTIKYKTIRRTYSIASLPVFRHGDDASITTKSQYNVLEIESHELGTWKGTANDFKLEYVNRSNKYQIEKQPAQDLANRLIQGRTVTVNKSFRGVGLPATAALVATREMRAASFPRPTFTIYVNRDAAWDATNSRYIEPSDVRKLISYKYGWTKILRILEVGIGKEDDSRVRLVCSEDVFGVGAAAFASTSGSGFTYPLDAAAISSYVVQDAPYFLTRDDDPRVLIFAAKPSNSQIKYDVLVSTDLGNSYSEEGSDADYAIKGTITESVARLTDTKVASLTFTPSNTFDATRLESASTTEIADEAANLIYWEDTGEWGAVETITNNGDGTYTLENVWRAVGGFDSVPGVHSSGATVWFFTYGRGFTSEHAAASALRLKLISNAPGGDYAEASASAISHTTSTRALKPLPVRGVTISGDYLLSTIGSANDLVIAWKETNRTTEATVTLQTDTGVTPEASVTYTVRIYRNGSGTATRTTTGLTSPAWTYTVAQETTDAGGTASTYKIEIDVVRGSYTSTTYVREVARAAGPAATGSNNFATPFITMTGDATIQSSNNFQIP